MALLNMSPSPDRWWEDTHPWANPKGRGEDHRSPSPAVLTPLDSTINPLHLLTNTNPYPRPATSTVSIPHSPSRSDSAENRSSRFSPPHLFDNFSQSGSPHPTHHSTSNCTFIDASSPHSPNSLPASPDSHKLTLLPPDLPLLQPIPQRPLPLPRLISSPAIDQSFLPKKRDSRLPPQNPVLRSLPSQNASELSPAWRKRTKGSLKTGKYLQYRVNHPYPETAEDQQRWHEEHVADWYARKEARRSEWDGFCKSREKAHEYRLKVQAEQSGYDRARKAYRKFLAEHPGMRATSSYQG